MADEVRAMRIRLGADTSELQKKLRESQKSLKGFTSNVTGLQKAMAGIGAAVGLGLLANKIRRIGVESVRTFGEAEATWNRLGGQLRAVGVEFSAVEAEIRRNAAAMQEATVVGDEEYATTLQRLIGITGDYNASVKEMGTVADFAVGAKLDMGRAAMMVGRAMKGETSMLKRYGVVVEEGQDAMQALRDQFGGLAENEARSFEGRVKQIKNAMADLAEEVGRAIVGGDDMPEVLSNITLAIQDLTKSIERLAPKAQAFTAWTVKAIDKAFLQDIRDIAAAYDRIAGAIKKIKDADARLQAGMLGIAMPRATTGSGPERPAGFGGAGPALVTRPDAPEDSPIIAALRRQVNEERAAAANKAAEDLRKSLEQLDESIRKNVQFGGLAGRPTSGGIGLTQEGRERALANRRRLADFKGAGGILEPKGSRFEASGGPNAQAVERGPLAKIGDAFKAQLGGAISQFGYLAAAAAVLAPVFQGLKEAVGPALEAIKEPLRIFGQLLGAQITPLLKLLAPPLRLLAKISSYVTEALGWLVRSIGKLIDSLPFVSAKGIINAGQEMVDSAREAREALDGVKEGLDRTNESLTNVPRVLPLALRRFEAAGRGPTTGSPPGGGAGGGGVERPGRRDPIPAQHNTYNLNLPGIRSPEEFERWAQEKRARGGGSAFALQGA